MIYKEKKKVLNVIVLVVESAPMDGVGFVSCDVSLVGGACACVMVDRAGSCLFEGECSVQ